MAKGASGGRSVKGKGGGGKPFQPRRQQGSGPPFQGGRRNDRPPRDEAVDDGIFLVVDDDDDAPDSVDERPRGRGRQFEAGPPGRGGRPGGPPDRSERPDRRGERSGGFGERGGGLGERSGGYGERSGGYGEQRSGGFRDDRRGGFGGGGNRGGFGGGGDDRRGSFGGGNRGGFGGGPRPTGPRPPGGGRPMGGPPRSFGGDDRPRPRPGGFGGPRRDDWEDRPGRPDDRRRPGPAGDLLYGRNAVLEALRAGREIRRVMVATGAHGEVITEIVDRVRDRKISLQSVDRRRLDAMAMNHQGVIAEVAPFQYASLEEVIEATRNTETPPLVLVLDVLQDPQNLGSLLRTAAAAGAQGVVILEHRAVGVTPAVMKASAGALERLRIAQVGNISHAIDALKEAGLWAVGLDARAEQGYDKADLNRPLTLVVGGEEKGLRPLVRDHCDMMVSLPMPGEVESLNAAVAGSIVIYEALRQRQAGPTSEPSVPIADLPATASDLPAMASDLPAATADLSVSEADQPEADQPDLPTEQIPDD